MARQPNIVLCICDQLRPFEVGCYGNDRIRTPNIDRLAGGGVRFETAMTAYPVCMAARSALISGQYNRTCTGGVSNVNFAAVRGNNMPEYPFAGRPHLPAQTLPEALQAAGYDTALIGKWHIHSWPHEVGFQRYVMPRVHHCHTGQCFTEDGGPEFVPDGYSVEYEAKRVEQYLGARTGNDRPFFLYYSISPPHCPVADAPDRITGMYSEEDVVVRPNVDLERRLDNQDLWFKIYRHDFRHYNLGLPYADRLPEGYNLRALMAEYYGMTTWMDEAVGRMLDSLDANGLADDTIVVFTSDHGDNLGSHGLVQKGGPNEESARIPLVIRAPGRLPSGEVDASSVASLVDVAPTLLGMAGVPVPNSMPGSPLTTHSPGHAIVETGGGAAIRTRDHMLYLPFGEGARSLSGEPAQLFDMAADPYQMHNLVGTPEAPAITGELVGRLLEWDASTPWMMEATPAP